MDTTAAVVEKHSNARRHLASLLLLARQYGIAVFLVASLLSKVRVLGDPLVVVFMALVLTVITALFWPAMLVGAAAAVLIEGIALCVAWFHVRPFLHKMTRWDLVSADITGP